MALGRFIAFFLGLASIAWSASSSHALPELTAFEQNHVLRACAHLKLEPSSAASGRRLDFIRIYRFPVMVDFEGLPQFPNLVHAVTREHIIKRELVIQPGDPYDSNRIGETIRNLKSLGIFTLVAAMPTMDREKNEYGLVLVTRDLWSLRLESAYQFTGATLDALKLQLTERNLAGLGKLALIRFELSPFTISSGGLYLDPRLLGHKLRLQASADAIFLREDGDYNGYRTLLSVDRPFYQLSQRWGFSSVLQIQDYGGRNSAQGQLLSYDDPETLDVEQIPMEWRSKLRNAEALGRVQIGRRLMLRAGLGAGLLLFDSRPADSTNLSQYSDATARRFRTRILPEDLKWFYPVGTLSVFENRFKTYLNLSGYAVGEELQLGFSSGLSVRAPLRSLGSDESLLSLGGRVTWREAILGDGLIELALGSSARLRPTARMKALPNVLSAPGVSASDVQGYLAAAKEKTGSQSLTDLTMLARVRAASPRLSWGRIVSRTDLLNFAYWDDLPLLTLGGDNGLRGYSSQSFLSFGGHRLRTNLEYRSTPVRLANLRGGVVAFYDAGYLRGGSSGYSGLKQSIGTGVRMVIPQVSRQPYRVDLGFPVDGSGFMITVTGGNTQAVPMTPTEDLLFLNGRSVGGLASQR